MNAIKSFFAKLFRKSSVKNSGVTHTSIQACPYKTEGKETTIVVKDVPKVVVQTPKFDVEQQEKRKRGRRKTNQI
jgi:hypothetical protein